MKFYIVGSTLKSDPRDCDLLGVMDDDHFLSVYGLTPEQFMEEGRTSEWSPGQIKWKDECIGAIRILQELLPDRVPIDFKFIPESLLREPYQPISLEHLLAKNVERSDATSAAFAGDMRKVHEVDISQVRGKMA